MGALDIPRYRKRAVSFRAQNRLLSPAWAILVPLFEPSSFYDKGS